MSTTTTTKQLNSITTTLAHSINSFRFPDNTCHRRSVYLLHEPAQCWFRLETRITIGGVTEVAQTTFSYFNPELSHGSKPIEHAYAAAVSAYDATSKLEAKAFRRYIRDTFAA